MRLSEVLALPVCRDVRAVNREHAPQGHPDPEVLLAHVIDVPHSERWVSRGTLMLTTGLSWPHSEAELSELGEQLAQQQPAAVLLAVPGPLMAFPVPVARALAAAGIAALELPYSVPFASVVREVHEANVREQSALLERSEAIHRALTRSALGGGLSDVVETLALHLNRPVAMVGADGEYRLGAVAGLPAASVLQRELARPGAAPRGLAGGLLTPILLRGERAGGLWIGPDDAAGASPQDSGLDLRSAEHAATVAALLLLAQQSVEQREAQLGAAFVDMLLEGRLSDDPAADSAAWERARRLGFDALRPYVVALLTMTSTLPLSLDDVTRRERLAGQVRAALKTLGVAPLLSVGLSHLWLLLPASTSPERLWALLGNDTAARLSLVYTRPYTGAAGIAAGRAEALLLAPHVPTGEVRGAAQLLLPRALSGDRDAQRDLVASLLGPLERVRGGAALIQTVRALCEHGWAQDRAAAALAVHKNTLRYRIGRIEDLTGHSLNGADTRSLWWLALQLDSLEQTSILP
ncbi:helix-turn-helix domain-containing protein (plasmid) [Deinococcus sp. KNUC1210]|uniref:helix-turn-helix domain-containing protein n=1 Tax=Deinococcus sp. KNUC1210 TaxID=2917691 RepID=UPI001EF01E35|nr:helix-turn-helix domain-containing protein [Deinococcus sp. KNUC1210]ULH14082.1 helix-turn-helix domain-containing protein [Deinococcus sp. KNUC1210]